MSLNYHNTANLNTPQCQRVYSSHLDAFSSAICLSSSCVCDFSSSSFSLFCCSRLQIRSLRFLCSLMFCPSPARSLCFVSSAALYAALCLTAETICGVMNIYTCSINWMLLNTHINANIQLVMNTFGTIFPDKIFSLTFP